MSGPEWISHRGLAEAHTENSQYAFAAAIDAGFGHLETDLRSTADGGLVLHHDADLRRTAGRPALISDLTLHECATVTYKDGQNILTFEAFAEHFQHTRWILDIKPDNAPNTLRALHEWAVKNQCVNWLTANARFLLWAPQHLKILHRYFPHAETLANAWECRRAGLSILCGLPGLGKILPSKTYALPPRFLGRNLFHPRITRHYHDNGARFLAYLPEKKTDIEQALKSGADELLINGVPPRD